MITSLLNTYYFISTTISTINQSYYIKHIIYYFNHYHVSETLDFTHFVGLKICRKLLDYMT